VITGIPKTQDNTSPTISEAEAFKSCSATCCPKGEREEEVLVSTNIVIEEEEEVEALTVYSRVEWFVVETTLLQNQLFCWKQQYWLPEV
jgi:hypothetical protein